MLISSGLQHFISNLQPHVDQNLERSTMALVSPGLLDAGLDVRFRVTSSTIPPIQRRRSRLLICTPSGGRTRTAERRVFTCGLLSKRPQSRSCFYSTALMSPGSIGAGLDATRRR